MPRVSIQIPMNGDHEYFEDPSPYYPIWLISGAFDMSPYSPVLIGRGSGQALSTFCTVDIRVFEDGTDSLGRHRPILKQTVSTIVHEDTSTYHIGEVRVSVPSPGTAIISLIAVLEIYSRSWSRLSKFPPRKAKCQLVASACSDPVRMSMVNHIVPGP